MRRAASTNRPPAISLFDEATMRCRNIATLAALLELCAHAKERMLEAELISHAGEIISKDVEVLRRSLLQLQNELARHQRKT